MFPPYLVIYIPRNRNDRRRIVSHRQIVMTSLCDLDRPVKTPCCRIQAVEQAVWRDQPKVYTCGKRRVRCLDRYDLTNLQGEAAAGLYGTIGSHFHIKLARCAHHRNGLLRAQTFFCGRYIYSKTGQHHDQCQYDSQALVLLHLFHPLPFAATIPGQMLLRLLPYSPLCYSLKQDSRSCPEKTWNRGLLP